MTIMTSYFWIRDDVIIFKKFHKTSTHRIFLPRFSMIWLKSEKIWIIYLFNHIFSQALPPFNWLPWQQRMTYT